LLLWEPYKSFLFMYVKPCMYVCIANPSINNTNPNRNPNPGWAGF